MKIYCICEYLHKESNSANKNNSLAMEDLLFLVCILPVIIESSTIFWWNAWHNWCHYFCWQHHHATQYQLQLEDCWPLVVKLKIRAKWKNNFFSGIVDNFFASFEFKGKRKCYIQQLFSVFLLIFYGNIPFSSPIFNYWTQNHHTIELQTRHCIHVSKSIDLDGYKSTS